jgi:hypothetical protein
VASRPSINPLAFFDVALVLVAAPIMLLIGVPALGYGLGAGAWLALRLVGLGVDRAALATSDARRQIALRMAYMLGRLFLLAFAVILARQNSKGDGLAALAVIVIAFTVQLVTSALTRPRSR